jgi:hypothetical protein
MVRFWLCEGSHIRRFVFNRIQVLRSDRKRVLPVAIVWVSGESRSGCGRRPSRALRVGPRAEVTRVAVGDPDMFEQLRLIP